MEDTVKKEERDRLGGGCSKNSYENSERGYREKQGLSSTDGHRMRSWSQDWQGTQLERRECSLNSVCCTGASTAHSTEAKD